MTIDSFKSMGSPIQLYRTISFEVVLSGTIGALSYIDLGTYDLGNVDVDRITVLAYGNAFDGVVTDEDLYILPILTIVNTSGGGQARFISWEIEGTSLSFRLYNSSGTPVVITTPYSSAKIVAYVFTI